MTLVLDIGNTVLKWRLHEPGGMRQGEQSHQRAWQSLLDQLADEVDAPIDALWVASVAGREADQRLAPMLEDRFQQAPQFYYSCACEAGVRNAYAEPERLGVDRWLAMLEAWHRYGPAIVVDCGSALTLDAVDRDGVHQGGYIVPGLAMLRESLATSTADVQVARDSRLSLTPGRSTAEGVRHGILRMSAAFINDAVVELQRSVADTCNVLITGGDGEHLVGILDTPAQQVPDLVLDGLERVMRQDHGG